MGNYLFQVAAAIGYADRHLLHYSVPDTTDNPKSNPIYLQHLVNPVWVPGLDTVLVEEHGHEYQLLPYNVAWRGKNIILDGYWQSEKYFEECRELVLRDFGYKWEPTPGVVSVHVRRGDYLRLPNKHPKVTKDWYEAAMLKFPGMQFKFFSDDLEWCKHNFFKRADCSFSTNANEEQDLVEISECEHHISSSSTFSWWGAYLNQNPDKRVVIPKNWFMPQEEARNSTIDIVPASWERL